MRLCLQTTKTEPVAALRLEPLPGPDAGHGAATWFVLVASAHACVHLVGAPAAADAAEPPLFAPLFAPANKNRRRWTVPGDGAGAGAAFYAQFPSPPTRYAWLGACGVTTAAVDLRRPTACVRGLSIPFSLSFVVLTMRRAAGVTGSRPCLLRTRTCGGCLAAAAAAAVLARARRRPSALR